MQRGGGHIATDPNPRIATKDLDVSRLMGYHLCWLCPAGHRRCHDRKKQGRFRCLTNTALRTELARTVLAPPLEHHVGVEPIAQRQFRDRYVWLTGFDGQSAFEFSRVIGPTGPTPRNNFSSIQNGPHYFIWRAPLSLTVTLFARRPRNDAYTIDGDNFSADVANPALSSFSDGGKTGWIDPNTGQVMVDGKAYSRVTRGWELAARLQEAGVAKLTADQVPWQDNQVGHVTAELVKLQLAKFGGTASNSGSDYTYRTDAYNHAGKWMFSHGPYSVGTPKSGPGRLSAGVAMFSIDGFVSQDKKTINVKSFSYSGPMLVCPANGHECTASPGRSFTGLSCSVTL